MPQSKGKEGGYHDVAFPLSGDLRRAISDGVLSEFNQRSAERGEQKRPIAEQLAEGRKQSARQTENTPAKPAAKRSPGLGD
jgi:hypothetical protein